jgi:hypothetical protein
VLGKKSLKNVVRLHCIVVFFSFDSATKATFKHTKEVHNSYVGHQCKTLPIEQACRYFSFSFSLVGLAGSLVRLVSGSWSIFATFFSIIKIKNSLHNQFYKFRNKNFGLQKFPHWWSIGLNCTSSKPKMLTCQTHSKSLPIVHL